MPCEKENLHSLSSEELEIYLKLHRGLAEANRFRQVTGFFLVGSLDITSIREQDHHLEQAKKLAKAIDTQHVKPT